MMSSLPTPWATVTLTLLFAAVAGAQEPPEDGDVIPPPPQGWNLTRDDLERELRAGERESITVQELAWAHTYERGALPEGTRYPRRGDVYEVTVAHEVGFMMQLTETNAKGGNTGLLVPGDRFLVPFDSPGIMRYAVSLWPVQDDAMAARLIPQSVRSRYPDAEVRMVVELQDLMQYFMLVEEGRATPFDVPVRE